MENMKENITVYESKDKQIVPFLLTQSEAQFLGTRIEYSTLYFQFTPYDICQKLANDFVVRKAPKVQPKDLLEAVETYRDMVFDMKMKDKRNRYEG